MTTNNPVEPSEAMIEEYQRQLRLAYIAGATDVHANWQEDRDPDFSEAAYDYVANLDDAAMQTAAPVAVEPSEAMLPREYLLLASYCGTDNINCTERSPCSDCRSMCNVFDENKTYLRELGAAMQSAATPSPVGEVREVVEELRAIGEEEMYQQPATTHKIINRAADLLSRLGSDSGWRDIADAPKDETWVELYGLHYGDEPMVRLGFWGEGDDWFDSEAASHSLTAFGWEPTHWKPFAPPSSDPVGEREG